MKKISLPLMLSALLMAGTVLLASCGESNDNPVTPELPEPVDPVTPTEDEAMSPADQKEYLETVAMEFMDKMPSSDFNDIGKLSRHITTTYVENYDWDNVGTWAEDIFEALRQSLGTTTTTTSGDDYNTYNSIYTNYKAVLMASNFTGHFTASGGQWNLTEADDLQFIFDDQRGQQCVVRLETSGEVKMVHAFDVDDWTDYDEEMQGNKYISNDYYDRTHCTLGVPQTITVTLTQGGTQVLKTTVETDLSSLQTEDFDLSKEDFTISASVEVNNGYRFNLSQVAYTANTKASVAFQMTKNGEPLVTVAAAADVHDIPACNIDAFSQSDFDLDDYDTDETNAENAFVKVDLIGKVQIQGTVADVRRFADYVDEADSNDHDESLYKSYLNQANALTDLNLFYDGTAVKQATATLEPFADEEWNGETYWTMEPVLNFYDGSSYSTFEAFFNDNDFKSVIDTFKALAERYADFIDESIDW